MTVPETIKLSEDEIERKIIEFQGTAKGQDEEVLDSGKLMEDLSIEDMKVSSAVSENMWWFISSRTLRGLEGIVVDRSSELFSISTWDESSLVLNYQLMGQN